MTRLGELVSHKLARPILSALRAGPMKFKDLEYQVMIAIERPVHDKTFSATNDFLRQRRYVTKQRHGRITRYHITTVGEGYLTILETMEAMERELAAMALQSEPDGEADE